MAYLNQDFLREGLWPDRSPKLLLCSGIFTEGQNAFCGLMTHLNQDFYKIFLWPYDTPESRFFTRGFCGLIAHTYCSYAREQLIFIETCQCLHGAVLRARCGPTLWLAGSICFCFFALGQANAPILTATNLSLHPIVLVHFRQNKVKLIIRNLVIGQGYLNMVCDCD